MNEPLLKWHDDSRYTPINNQIAVHQQLSRSEAVAFVKALMAAGSIDPEIMNDEKKVAALHERDLRKSYFPHPTYQRFCDLDRPDQHLIRAELREILIVRRSNEELANTLPIEVLLSILRKARARFWMPVLQFDRHRPGIDISELMDVFPGWLITPQGANHNSTADICLKLAEVCASEHIAAGLAIEVNAQRASLVQIWNQTKAKQKRQRRN